MPALAALPAATEAQNACAALPRGQHWNEPRKNHTGGTKKIADRVKATFGDTDTLTRAGVCHMARQNVADGLFGSSLPWCRASGHTADWEATYKELDRLEKCRADRTTTPPPPPPPNETPTLTKALPALDLRVGGSTTVNLANYFSDPEQETITYTATRSGGAINLSLSGPLLTVTAAASGDVTITVSAEDPHGSAAVSSMSVRVAKRVEPQGDPCPPPAVYGSCNFLRDPSRTCRVDPEMSEAEWPADWGDPPPWPPAWPNSAAAADDAGVSLDEGQWLRLGPLHAYLSCWKYVHPGPATRVTISTWDGSRRGRSPPPESKPYLQPPIDKWLYGHKLHIKAARPGLALVHLVVTGYREGRGGPYRYDWVPTDRFVVGVNTSDFGARSGLQTIKGMKDWVFTRGYGQSGWKMGVDAQSYRGTITFKLKAGRRMDFRVLNIGSQGSMSVTGSPGITLEGDASGCPRTRTFSSESLGVGTAEIVFRPTCEGEEHDGRTTTIRVVVD